MYKSHIDERVSKGSVLYSKTCVKRPLKNQIDKIKLLLTNGSLIKVKVLQNAHFGAFCNTFDLH